MPYIRNGEVVEGGRRPLRLSSIRDFFFWLLDLVWSFFATLFSADSQDAYANKKQRNVNGFGSGGGPGGGGGGGGGGGPRGPRISGMDRLRKMGGGAAPGG